MDTTTPAYGSPEAKAQIKELKAQEEAFKLQLDRLNDTAREYAAAHRSPDWHSWEDPAYQALQAQTDAPREALRQVRNARLDLQTCPLPCAPSALPAKALPDSVATVPATQPQRGDTVALHSRGMVRLAMVVEVTKTRAEVAYTTQGAITEALRRGWSTPCVTRKNVKHSDLYTVVA